MAGLPKNISIVQYKNADGTKQVKYRARITVKGQKFNRLFDELAHAKTYLTEAKSHFGRKAIDEADIAEQMAFEEWKRPTFEWFIDNYFKWRYPEPPKDAPILKRCLGLGTSGQMVLLDHAGPDDFLASERSQARQSQNPAFTLAREAGAQSN